MHNYSNTHQVNSQRIGRAFFLALAMGVSSCASLTQPFPFDVQNVSSSSGELRRVAVRTDDAGVFLYGKLSYGEYPGHVDASITTPEGSTTCMSEGFTLGPHGPSFSPGYRQHARHSRQQFEIRLDTLPEVSSLVQVRHHQGEVHQSCATDWR